jgi:hypothetical protein
MIKLNTVFPTKAYIPLLLSSASYHKYLTNTHMQFVRKRRIINAKPAANHIKRISVGKVILYM